MTIVRIGIIATCVFALGAGAQWKILQEWSFDGPGAAGWRPGRHLQAIKVSQGTLSGEPAGHDPQLISPPIAVEATMWQEVHVRMRCDRAGSGELFFSNTFDEPYGGFRSEWMVPYDYKEHDAWQVVRIRPFWKQVGTIRQIRLDPPSTGAVAIDWIRIVALPSQQPLSDSAWKAEAGVLPGWSRDDDGFWVAPALDLAIDDLPWLHLDIAASTEGHATVRWVTDEATTIESDEFFLSRDGRRHTYRLDLGTDEHWTGRLVYLAVKLSGQHGATPYIHSLRLAPKPPQTPDVHVLYFGPENAVARVNQPCSFLLRLVNTGSEPAKVTAVRSSIDDAEWTRFPSDLQSPDGVTLRADIPWTSRLVLKPRLQGTLVIALDATIAGRTIRLQSEPMIVSEPAPNLPPGRIPEPEPAKTDYRIGTYYYPGFGTPYQWRQLERTAPWAKPVLGYYDEGNPECIDWQIKWAVEHGIRFFLIDWYWVAGRTRHMHYLEGLAKARFREHLKWAVMWANHNPPNTHSPKDWHDVVAYWIEHYMHTPDYLRVDGKPAVFIWSPHNIRRDVGGSEQAAPLYETAQRMAREAGLPGITFVAMRQSPGENLRGEGYTHVTSYHWWADARSRAENPRYLPYSLIVERSRQGWTRRAEELDAANLTFLPVVDTGWDARPRHGNQTLVIYDRTPDLFEKVLTEAKEWLDKRNRDMLILAPVNEWTEGSYIEPCTAFGFRMYQAVHKVFCNGPPPPVITPPDIGLGPYDFDLNTAGATADAWSFATSGNARGWRLLMGLKDMRVADGALAAVSTTHDPAIISERLALSAADYKAISITMQVAPAPKPGDQLLVFWGTETSPIHSRAFVKTALNQQTGTQTYRLTLENHPRWRGRLRYLRIDPCLTAEKQIRITDIRLVKSDG